MATIRCGGNKSELITRAFNRLAMALVVAQADPNQIHHRVLHGHFDLLADSGGVTLHQGGQDTDDAVHTRARVAHTRPGDRGRIVGKTGHAHRAAHRLGHGFKTLERTMRPIRTKAFDAGIDQARIELFEAVIAKPEPFHRAGSEVLQHDICGCNQFFKSLLAFRLFEVKRQAALVGVEKKEKETVRPRLVIQTHAGDIAPSGRFDLDHVSPEPGQNLATRRASLIVGQVQHPDTIKRSAHCLMLPSLVFGPRQKYQASVSDRLTSSLSTRTGTKTPSSFRWNETQSSARYPV